jgi:hypothetical protein
LVTSKTIFTWFPDKSLCAKLDFPSIAGPGLVTKNTSPVVSFDPERGILIIPLPVKPYSAEKLLVAPLHLLQILTDFAFVL